MGETVLTLNHITKTYPGVVALDDFSISFEKGEVHALLGENGAGKSTLIKVIAGAIHPDSGTIRFGDTEHHKITPHISRSAGVEVIYQEFNLVSTLSAAENIYLGDRTGRFVDQKLMNRRAKELFDLFEIDIDPSTLVRDLPSSMQQIVEITKAVAKNARILIMDEPSAPLSVTEVEHLFRIIRKSREQGVTIIYISHRIDELFAISDRVSVMRDGCFVETKKTAETNRKELINLMVGRELSTTYIQHKAVKGDTCLELRNVTGNGDENISFSLHKGEILGVAGLVGAGRTEMANVIFGAAKMTSGEILIDGKIARIRSPEDAIRLGIGLIPENRKEAGCFLEMTVKWNISFANIRNISRGFLVNRKKEDEQAAGYRDMLRIKTPSLDQRVKNLSGGNQQKIVLAKTLATKSNIIVFDEPTRGIDVGARQEIYKLMSQLVEEGKAILMITSDMEELLGMSDRIMVIAEGSISGFIEKSEFSQNRVLELASKSKMEEHA